MKLIVKKPEGGFEVTLWGVWCVPVTFASILGLTLLWGALFDPNFEMPTLSTGPDRLTEYKILAGSLENHQSSWCRRKAQSVGFLLAEVTSVTPQTEILYESLLKDAKEAKCL